MSSRLTRADVRVRQHFEAVLQAHGYRADVAQQAAIDHLGQWLSAFLQARPSWLRRRAAGVYLHGGVGRGKSFVLDACFAAAPLAQKRRVHFHVFLQELQQRLGRYAGQADPLAKIAAEIAGQTRLLCFDEFHVHDIGDAVLLGRLLTLLVGQGVGLICTSNYPPGGLCPNPLYRARFQPTIALLEQRFDVLQLDGGYDYRQGSTRQWGRLCWPLQEQDDWLGAQLGLSIAATRDANLLVNQHPLRLRGHEGARAWLDFTELFRRPRSSADYLWLCAEFRELAIGGVPRLAGEGVDVQQRFLNFIDIAYDRGIELLLGCAASLDELCPRGIQSDLSRTHSRLQQLQALPLSAVSMN
ncbi:MAG TPA: cell division protein ZapE [Pseudomonas sp.]|nr:cell division protein ZapE [Pseudomonas sp.]